MQENRWRQKLVVTISGSLMLLYCVIVLAYVATVPDLRLRVLLADDNRPDDPTSSGVVVRDVPGLLCRGPKPAAGDILVRIGDQWTVVGRVGDAVAVDVRIAGIAGAIAIGIYLGRVGDERAVIAPVQEAIAVLVGIAAAVVRIA